MVPAYYTERLQAAAKRGGTQEVPTVSLSGGDK